MKGNASHLFGFIAECVKSFIEDEKKKGKTITISAKFPLGFTFSFPVDQQGVAKGTLIKWTKGFTTTGVEGQDVVALLNNAFKQRNINVEVVALANDTVGTMVTRSYEDPNCEVGVILGTGSNACYAEKVSNIKKFTGQPLKGGIMIVNMEWGGKHYCLACIDYEAFGDGKNILKQSSADKQLDKASLNPGFQLFEKMISGMYLGEIARLAIVELQQRGVIFKGATSNVLSTPYLFLSKCIFIVVKGMFTREI
jgi:hexokinase